MNILAADQHSPGSKNKMSDTIFPDQTYFAELVRPWKLISFAAAMAWLLYGAVNYHISDWDVGVSLIMGTLTYVTAPWSVRSLITVIRSRPRNSTGIIVAVLFVSWFVIDGVYVLYHTLAGNQMLREENFYASTPLYFIAGMVWLYRGSVKQLLKNICHIFLLPK